VADIFRGKQGLKGYGHRLAPSDCGRAGQQSATS
jgi:hypothetical protein